jgi:AcrR family transcriptional regulator
MTVGGKVRNMPARSSQKLALRADALHNRNRILDVARQAFTTRGIDVPMATIARRAGIGVATLYRRFPTRESLILEVFADQFAACASIVDDALVDPDPWRGFRGFVERVCAMQVADRGLTEAFLGAFPSAVDHRPVRSRAEASFALLIQRAKDSGSLRGDFDRADLVLLLMANNGVIAASGAAAPAASRRFVAYLLQSFHADHARALPPPVPLELHHLAPGLQRDV